MTVEEMSNQFDVLYNNITSNQAPGLDEYEKSVFLTKAQNELVKAYFSPALNKTLNGFDNSPIRQADFSTIINNCTLRKVINTSTPLLCFDVRATSYELPKDLFISLNELLVSGNIPYTVVPITFLDYNRLMSKPYKYPLKYQAWRMITKNCSVDYVEKVTLTLPIDDNTHTITIASNCGKQIKFIVTIIPSQAGSSLMPTIDNNNGVITITCKILLGTSTGNYFNLFLKQKSDTNNYEELIKYIKPFNVEGDTNSSLWPIVPIPTNTPTANIVTIINNGGSTPHLASIAEVVGRFSDPENISYNIRYIRKLKPIVLTNLSDIDNALSIEGESEITASELPSELHEDILQRAVELAKAAYSGTLADTVSLGSNSGTEKGVVPRGN